MLGAEARAALWQPLPDPEWQPTIRSLHRWSQIVGKVRMALAQPINGRSSVVAIGTRREPAMEDSIRAQREVIVGSRIGLHARPAAPFVKAAAGQPVKITIRKGDGAKVRSNVVDAGSSAPRGRPPRRSLRPRA